MLLVYDKENDRYDSEPNQEVEPKSPFFLCHFSKRFMRGSYLCEWLLLDPIARVLLLLPLFGQQLEDSLALGVVLHRL